MKRALVLCMAFCLSAGAADAGILETFRLQTGLGAGTPLRPEGFRDFWNIGPTAGVGISHEMAPGFETVLHLDFYSYSLNDKKVLAERGLTGRGIGIAGGRISHYTAMLNIKMMLRTRGSRVLPYVLGGAGIYKLSVGSRALSAGNFLLPFALPVDQTTAAMQVGMGLDIVSVMNIDFFAEARVIVAPAGGGTVYTIPIKFGIRSK